MMPPPVHLSVYIVNVSHMLPAGVAMASNFKDSSERTDRRRFLSRLLKDCISSPMNEKIVVKIHNVGPTKFVIN